MAWFGFILEISAKKSECSERTNEILAFQKRLSEVAAVLRKQTDIDVTKLNSTVVGDPLSEGGRARVHRRRPRRAEAVHDERSDADVSPHAAHVTHGRTAAVALQDNLKFMQPGT